MHKIYYSALVFILASFVATAQKSVPQIDDNGDDPYDDLSYFTYGLNYLSNNVYLGRKDTSRIPYYSPYIGYHFENGLFAKGMVSLTPVNGTHIDVTTLEAGYEHSFGDYFTGGIDADRYFYNKNSINVRANTVGDANISGMISNVMIEPTLIAGIDFNRKSSDFVTTLMLDHDFKLAHNKMHILPGITVNLSTQHYLDEYLVKRRKDASVKKVVDNASRFVPMDFEINTKLTYMTPQWLFSFLPTYAIPVNAATLDLPVQGKKGKIVEKQYHEQISNSFFVELDISHR